MEEPRVKIDGVYDKRTLQSLEGSNVFHVGFDFRPKSFNFLQLHRFLQLISEGFNSNTKYFMHYSYEQNYIIQKFLDDLKEELKKRPANNESVVGVNPILTENFMLEFSDLRDPAFYEQFDTDFFWHYRPDASVGEMLKCPHLKGIVFPFIFLKELHENGTLFNFVQNFYQSAFKVVEQRGISLVLSLDWDDDVFPSLEEYFEFDYYSLSINRHVEVCYRNVDLNKVKSVIGAIA